MDNTVQSPFSLTAPWKASGFSKEAGAESSLFPSPNFDYFISLDHPYALETHVRAELKLPDLDTFQYGPLEDIPLPDESVVTSDENKCLENKDDDEDIWKLVVGDGPVFEHTIHKSWDNFLQPGREELCSPYLSEAGPKAFDAALRIHYGDQDSVGIPVIKGDVFLRSLFALGLGRSSSLFWYDFKKKDFEQYVANGTMSGYSDKACRSLVTKIMSCGRTIRHLRDFADRTYTSGKAIPARVALANSIASIIDTLELHLTSTSEHLSSLLQIQHAFERPHQLFTEIYDLVKSLRHARSNEELASAVFKRCQNCDQEPGWLRDMMLRILARVARPWLEVVEQWIGFQDDTGSLFTGKQEHAIFVAQDDKSDTKVEDDGAMLQEPQYVFRPDKLPTFISPGDGQMIFDIGRDIRILRVHHPEHPLTQTVHARKHDMSLRWRFGWQDADLVLAKAVSFEHALGAAINEFQNNGNKAEVALSESVETDASNVAIPSPISEPFAFEGIELFQPATSSGSQPPEDFFGIVESNSLLKSDADLVEFYPPIPITPVLSFMPLLAAQQRLINAVMIRMFFRRHKLRMHLNLQRSYHLLGDGVFVSRLTAALFDPDQSSTERQRGVMRGGSGMGLRLGSRGTWPPASSELRLALMGILTECFHDAFQRESQNTFVGCNRDLPGSLSFAIRQLSEQDAERILDADTLHALDFLRLQYASPAPLDAILTAASLERYDTIFKFLLQLERLLFVVSHLPRNFPSLKTTFFRLQAEHFVSTCCRYFLDTGVSETWIVFMEYLDSLEKRLAEEDEVGELGTRVSEGIDDIRKQHDLCLDRITFALLLRNRQQKVMAVLEDILSTILHFSKLCHDADTADIDMAGVERLQIGFDEKMKLFLDVCRGLVGKKGYGKPGGDGRGAFGGKGTTSEENTIERLVVALDYNGFYARHG